VQFLCHARASGATTNVTVARVVPKLQNLQTSSRSRSGVCRLDRVLLVDVETDEQLTPEQLGAVSAGSYVITQAPNGLWMVEGCTQPVFSTREEAEYFVTYTLAERG
jgi:hypothetical protein